MPPKKPTTINHRPEADWSDLSLEYHVKDAKHQVNKIPDDLLKQLTDELRCLVMETKLKTGHTSLSILTVEYLEEEIKFRAEYDAAQAQKA